MTLVLGIETSCDETAAAVVRGDRAILSNVIFSQIDQHKVYGGVVPEVAARAHVDKIDVVIEQAVREAGVDFTSIDAVAATAGPGLIGGVMVGLMAGKALSLYLGKPFIAVNHLEGHALSPRLSDDVAFPYLLLLASGGHTQILLVEGVGQYTLLGGTIDDAAGECFDKTAKLIGLGYPGGPQLEKMAAQCADPQGAAARFGLPRPLEGRKQPDFSFSGLKTAVRTQVEKLTGDGNVLAAKDAADLCCALQTAIADTIYDRCRRACDMVKGKPVTALVVAGGVAANTAIRARLTALAAQYGLAFAAPPARLCTDNGAMIAWAGYERFRLGITSPLDHKAFPRWPLSDMVFA